jgi:hypothetical protein
VGRHLDCWDCCFGRCHDGSECVVGSTRTLPWRGTLSRCSSSTIPTRSNGRRSGTRPLAFPSAPMSEQFPTTIRQAGRTDCEWIVRFCGRGLAPSTRDRRSTALRR